MKLSLAAAYALHALVLLARHEGGGLVRADALAGGRTPVRALRKALTSLVGAGVLYGSRGAGGGYRLARPAVSITLLEVVEALDGPVKGEVPRLGKDAGLDARLREVCDRIAAAVRARLRKVTLADLAGEG
jgi:Rrf2 family protein